MRFLIVGLALLGCTAAIAEPIEPRKIITALTEDFNGDGAADLAMIAETSPTDPFDIYFFLRDKEHNYLKQVLVVHDQVFGEWNGYDRPGYENSDTEPELTALPNGSIKLFLPAMPTGAERTDQTLTLAYRGNTFVVTGFGYHHQDFQQERSEDSCDLNLLTGKGESIKTQSDGSKRRRRIAIEGQTIAFADWEAGAGFSACGP